MLFQSQFALASAPPQPIAFRSTNSVFNAGGTTSVAKAAGIVAGDLGVVVTPTPGSQTLATSGGGSWGVINLTVSGEVYPLFWKILDATDVANAWTLSSGGTAIYSFAYDSRSGSAVSLASSHTNPSGATSLTVSGFAPSQVSKGVLALFIDQDSTATDTDPSGWTARVTGNLGATRNLRFSDLVAGYAGAAVTWTNTSAAFTEGAMIVEVI